jgi:hypothetical protein
VAPVSRGDARSAEAACGVEGISQRTAADGTTSYQARVYRDGKRHISTWPTEHEALAWRSQTIKMIDQGREPPPAPSTLAGHAPLGVAIVRSVTVEDAACRLCKAMKEGSARTKKGLAYKPSTAREYEASLRVYVLPAIGFLPLATVTNGDI